MKVRVEIDKTLSEPEVIIRTASENDAVRHIEAQLSASPSQAETLVCNQGATTYFVALENILFIETADRQLQVHTATDIYESKQRLYKLIDTLPGYFLQVSKSTIINLRHVNALTRSLSSSLVSFSGSHKEVYASRRFVKQLQERLNEMRSL